MKAHLLTALIALAGISTGIGSPVEGTVIPFREVTLGSPMQGIIDSIPFEEGDSVKEGEIVVSLLRDLELLDIERYREVLKKAEFDHLAAKRLFEKNVATRDETMGKEMELRRLEAERDMALARLDEKEIKSPINGIVVRKLKEKGEAIDRAEGVIEIIDLSKVYLEFYLETSLFSKVSKGQKVAVEFPALDFDSTAEIAFIDPRIDASSGLFGVKLVMDNSEGKVIAGMRSFADFEMNKQQVSVEAASEGPSTDTNELIRKYAEGDAK